jgi:hypothetical protein
MKVQVEMRAFGKLGEIREVEIPDEEWAKATQEDARIRKEFDWYGARLELVFHWGQNEFQPQQHPSDGKRSQIKWKGFQQVILPEKW